MFDDIIQPFLADAEQGDALVFAQQRLINAPRQMADHTAVLQLHFAHQRTHRLFKRQVVQLARAQAAQQAAHRIIDAERKLLNQLAALPDAGAVRRQTLDDPRLSTDGGDGLPDIIVQLAGHLAAHALFGFQQAFRQPLVTHQLVLQRLIQLAQPLNACAQQQARQALRQQRKQQIHRMIVPVLAGNQRDGVHQGRDQRALPAVVPGQGDNRQRQAERRKSRELGGQPQLEPETDAEQQQVPDKMPPAPVYRLRDQRWPQRPPDGTGKVVPDNQAGRRQRQAAGQGQQQRVQPLLAFRQPRQRLEQRSGDQRPSLTQQGEPVTLLAIA